MRFLEQWEQLIRSRKEEIKKRYAQLDKEVISELKEMYNSDQKYRLYMVNNWNEIYSPGHKKELDSLLRGQDFIDSLNFMRLKELTMKHGWLGYSKYGRFSEILITHVNKDFDYFLRLMVDAARKGELEWTHVDICVKRKMSCLLLSDNGAELDDIYFNSKSGALLPESNYQLDVLLNELELLKGYAKTIVISASYNKNESLSKKRIENIVKYLKEKRFDTSIIVQNNLYDKGLKRESEIIVKVITKK